MPFLVGPPPHQLWRVPVAVLRQFSSLLDGQQPLSTGNMTPVLLPHTNPAALAPLQRHLHACRLALLDRSHMLHLAVLCAEYPSSAFAAPSAAQQAAGVAGAAMVHDIAVRAALEILAHGQPPLIPPAPAAHLAHWIHIGRAWDVLGLPVRPAIMRHIGEHHAIYQHVWDVTRTKMAASAAASGTAPSGDSSMLQDAFDPNNWWFRVGLEVKRHSPVLDVPSAAVLVDADEEMKRWEDALAF